MLAQKLLPTAGVTISAPLSRASVLLHWRGPGELELQDEDFAEAHTSCSRSSWEHDTSISHARWLSVFAAARTEAPPGSALQSQSSRPRSFS